MPPPPRTPRPSRWNWPAALRQALAFALLAGLLVAMVQVTRGNLQARGIESGFDFLWKPAVTPVAGALIAFEAGVDTHARALAAGALNSLTLAAATIVAATVLGVGVGLARLSPHPLAVALARGYVEGMRNVPVLLHVFLWYGLVLELPPASAVSPEPGWLLATNRGVHLASFGLDGAGSWALDRPRVDGLEVTGGLAMSPEFLALFIGLSLYTAAFVAEIVRGSVQAVTHGQWEAATALGLPRRATLTRVVAPQALRVGIPALSSEYLGLFKNSTLAVAVGWQDFMAVGNTMLTDTGQSMEVMALVIVFYAVVSLAVSAAMHALERRQRHWGLV